MGRPKGSKNSPTKKRKVKDPNRPKRPTSAYFYFAAKCREDNAKNGIKIARVADFTKEVSAKWQALKPKDREPYEKLAAKDKQRYDSEVANYKGTKGGKVKDANRPKRPQTAYFLFLGDFRIKMKDKIKEHKELLRAAGEAWKNLSESEKKPYDQKAEVEKKAWDIKMAEYRKSGGGGPAAKKAKTEAANGTDDDEDDEEEEEEEEEDDEDEDDE